MIMLTHMKTRNFLNKAIIDLKDVASDVELPSLYNDPATSSDGTLHLGIYTSFWVEFCRDTPVKWWSGTQKVVK